MTSLPAKLRKQCCDDIVNYEKGDYPVEINLKYIISRVATVQAATTLNLSLENRTKNTPCILVNREKESRRRYLKEKAYCHLTAFRLFRAPWVKGLNDLRPVKETCDNTFKKHAERYCINPYHYEVREDPDIPKIPVQPNIRGIADTDTLKALQMRLRDERQNIDYVQNRDFTEGVDIDEVLVDSPLNHVNEAFFNGGDAPGTSTDYIDEDEEMEDMSELNDEIQYSPDCFVTQPVANMETPILKMVAYEDTKNWISVSYREFGRALGDPWVLASKHITINGSHRPLNKETIGIGYLRGCNTSAELQRVRRTIGRGITIYGLGGEIYVNNHCSWPVFVQSPSANSRYGFGEGTVIKIPSNSHFKLFNKADFAVRLAESVRKGYEAVYRLQSHCVMRISFAKGWGSEYKRKDLMDVPCYVEVNIIAPYEWVDKVLATMGKPEIDCGSFS